MPLARITAVVNGDPAAAARQIEEFWSEAGEEDIEKATLEFKAPENGKWFLVVENIDNKEVSATANIRQTPLKAGPSP